LARSRLAMNLIDLGVYTSVLACDVQTAAT